MVTSLPQHRFEPVEDTSTYEFRMGRARASARAKEEGWFFLPCQLCGTYYAGFEWAHFPDVCSSVPESRDNPNTGRGICPWCTVAGRGCEITAEILGSPCQHTQNFSSEVLTTP